MIINWFNEMCINLEIAVSAVSAELSPSTRFF